MKNYSWLGILVVATLTSQFAFSWGPEGHQTTALIAQQLLQKQSQTDPAARKALAAVNAILGQTTFAQAATWPDEVKKQSRDCDTFPYVKDPNFKKTVKGVVETGTSSAVCETYAYTAAWHFATVNADQGFSQYKFPSAVSSERAPSPYSDGDLVIIIKGLTHILRNENADVLTGVNSYANWKTQCLKKSDHNCKKEALEFLIHFLGDIHQPLHSGAGCDTGGNDQFITFFGEIPDPAADWCKPNEGATCTTHELHQAWDTTLLVKNVFKVVNNKPYVPPGFSAGYSKNLVSTMTPDQKSSLTYDHISDQKRCMTAAPGLELNESNMDDEVSSPNNGPINWVNESVCYFRQVYTFPDPQDLASTSVAKTKGKNAKRTVAQASTQANAIPNLCTNPKDGKKFKAFNVGQQYYDANMKVIDERLYWGGSRLASVLKYIYGEGDKIQGELP